MADYLLEEKEVFLHTENGLLGVGPTPSPEEENPEIINAGKLPVTAKESFGMIRGGHIDLAILGALQVGETGDVTNWAVPEKNILGVGGAMDLMVGEKSGGDHKALH